MKTRASKLDQSSPDDFSATHSAVTKLSFPGPHGEDACTISHAVPIDQPEQVHQLTPVLFSQYEVDNGTVTLGGCLLEDIPFLRVESLPLDEAGYNPPSGDQNANAQPSSATSDHALIPASPARSSNEAERNEIAVHFFHQSGEEVDPEVGRALGIDYPQPTESLPAHLNPNEVTKWLNPLLERIQPRYEAQRRQVAKCAIVWCKRAEGKIAITIDDESINIPFSGWAKQLASGQAPAPPFECPITSRKSYHITQTETGEITVPDAIKTCASSGKRVLESELVKCESSDRLCLPKYLGSSEVSGKRVMKERLKSCPQCGQRVGPEELSQERCVTCQKIGARPVDSGRISDLQRQLPGLSKWAGWQSSESASCEVFRAYGWLKTIVFCIDKSTGKPRKLMMGGRLSNALEEVAEADWPSVFGSP